MPASLQSVSLGQTQSRVWPEFTMKTRHGYPSYTLRLTKSLVCLTLFGITVQKGSNLICDFLSFFIISTYWEGFYFQFEGVLSLLACILVSIWQSEDFAVVWQHTALHHGPPRIMNLWSGAQISIRTSMCCCSLLACRASSHLGFIEHVSKHTRTNSRLTVCLRATTVSRWKQL